MGSINTDVWSLVGLAAAGFLIWAIGSAIVTGVLGRVLKVNAQWVGIGVIIWTVLMTATTAWWLSALWYNCGQ
jgi:hypothetical protein